MTMSHNRGKAHDHPDLDSPPAKPVAALAYKSLDDAVLAGDFATADIYFANENRTAAWLDSMIEDRKRTAANYDPSIEANPWNNNPMVAHYAAALATALEAYKVHRG
jgi:hypothetical protein